MAEAFEQGKRAARDGKYEEARVLPKQAVADDPKHPDAWLWLASVTDDEKATLQYLQRAVELATDDPRVQQALQRVLLATLKRDAFIAYLAETDRTYTVTLRNPSPVVVPKARAVYEVFPPPRLTEGQRVLRLPVWMTLGLLPLGIGTLFLLPYALWRSVQLLRTPRLEPIEQRRALVVLLVTLSLGILSVVLFGLLLLHWLG